MDYFNIAFMSLVRGLAVDIGDLKACLCEDDLVAKPPPAVTMKIDKGLLVEASIARAQLSDFASELEDLSGESIMIMFKNKMCILKTIDKYMKVEQGLFVSMTGDSGQAIFTKAVLDCIPEGKEAMTWSQSKARLEALLGSPFVKFCCKGILNQGQSIKNWLSSGEASRSPQNLILSFALMQSAKERLCNFCLWEHDQTQLFGKTALDKIVEEVSKKPPDSITLPMLKDLTMFKFMLSPSQDNLLVDWTDKALGVDAKAIKAIADLRGLQQTEGQGQQGCSELSRSGCLGSGRCVFRIGEFWFPLL